MQLAHCSLPKGPILVNSYDENSERAQRDPTFMSSNLRDPNDKDGRMKDFYEVSINAERRALFKSVFKADGFIWVWGCNADDVLYNLLRKIYSSGGGAPKTEKIELKNLTAQQIGALSQVATLLGIDVTRMRKTQRCVIPIAALKSMLLGLARECYAYELAAVPVSRSMPPCPARARSGQVEKQCGSTPITGQTPKCTLAGLA